MLTLCPICAGEFEMSATDCPSCGCSLVASTLDEDSFSEREADDRFDFVELCRSRVYPIAMLIKQTLEQNGIMVILQGGHFISVMPSLAVSGELRVLVPRHQLERARELYKAYFEGDEEGVFVQENEDEA